MSPYLLVIIIEKLAHLIQMQMEEGEWCSFRLTKNGPHISHIFFADDIIYSPKLLCIKLMYSKVSATVLFELRNKG